jgi:hypothetical protein
LIEKINFLCCDYSPGYYIVQLTLWLGPIKGSVVKYLPTAFAQLEFAWKLYNYALDGGIDLAKLDVPVTFQEGESMLVLPAQIFATQDDLIIACQNLLGIAFGAAAITLNRCREEAGLGLPNPITTERDQFVALTYQIRNAFAHDIAEPRWEIRDARYLRTYDFGSVKADLTGRHGQTFDYSHIGGPEVLFWMRNFGEQHVWP